jgi:hypothetical protein
MSPGPSRNVRACGREKQSKTERHGNTANYFIDTIRDPTIDHSILARQRTYRYA